MRRRLESLECVILQMQQRGSFDHLNGDLSGEQAASAEAGGT
jgi:hypothetical protein